jgi:hypothetical protein
MVVANGGLRPPAPHPARNIHTKNAHRRAVRSARASCPQTPVTDEEPCRDRRSVQARMPTAPFYPSASGARVTVLRWAVSGPRLGRPDGEEGRCGSPFNPCLVGEGELAWQASALVRRAVSPLWQRLAVWLGYLIIPRSPWRSPPRSAWAAGLTTRSMVCKHRPRLTQGRCPSKCRGLP